MNKCTIAGDMRKICKRINEDRPSFQPIQPHVLRRTFATLLNENGANMAAIQELLGHTSIETTRKYVGVSSSFRKAEIRKLSAIENQGEKGCT